MIPTLLVWFSAVRDPQLQHIPLDSGQKLKRSLNFFRFKTDWAQQHFRSTCSGVIHPVFSLFLAALEVILSHSGDYRLLSCGVFLFLLSYFWSCLLLETHYPWWWLVLRGFFFRFSVVWFCLFLLSRFVPVLSYLIKLWFIYFYIKKTNYFLGEH